MEKTVENSSWETKSIVIIEDDASMQFLIRNLFEELGCKEIAVTDDGAAGLEKCQSMNPDFVVIDWRVPQLAGVQLLNCLRQLSSRGPLPILVVSGFLKEKDFRLVEEIPFTALLEKPFSGDRLKSKVRQLMDEVAWIGEHAIPLETIAQKVSRGSTSVAASSAAIFSAIKSAPSPIPVAIMLAKRLQELRSYESALLIMVELLKWKPNCLAAVTELARIYLNLKRFEEAAYVLDAAKRMSPDNAERLLLLGHAQMNNMDLMAANQAFSDALNAAPRSMEAKQGLATVSAAVDYLRSQPSGQTPSFASLMNAIGISEVRKGNFAKAISSYQGAWSSVFGDELRSRLAFNFGLAYLRWKKPEESIPWFQTSLQLADEDFPKAREYLAMACTRAGVTPPPVENAAHLQPPLALDQGAPAIQKPTASEPPADIQQTSWETGGQQPKVAEGHFDFVPDTISSKDSGARDPRDANRDLDLGMAGAPTAIPSGSGRILHFDDHGAMNHIKKVVGPALANLPSGIPQTRSEFMKKIPEMEKIFQQLDRLGSYVDYHVSQFSQLAAQYGLALFRVAVLAAVRNQTPKAEAFARNLAQLAAEQKKLQKADRKTS